MPISGFEKSSSFSPVARNIARAPARLAPSVRAVLRGFNERSDTAEPPDTARAGKPYQAKIKTQATARKETSFHHNPQSVKLIQMYNKISPDYNGQNLRGPAHLNLRGRKSERRTG